jgi:hypothetical protein
MANVIVNDTNLINIANAIRAQNGTKDAYKPSEMAAAILAIEGSGGGYVPNEQDLTYSVSGNSPFALGSNSWIIREFGNQCIITFTNPSQSTAALFSSYPEEYFDANIVFNSSSAFMPVKNMFNGSPNLKEIDGSITFPGNQNNFARVDNADGIFADCPMLRVIADDFIDSDFCHWFNRTGTTYNRMHAAFYNCHSLREIPNFYYEMIGTNTNGEQPGITSATYGYTNLFQNCYALNKIEGLPVISGLTNGSKITSNMFANTFGNCYNLSKLTFQTNPDGTPLTANWGGQTIDLTGGCTSTVTIDGASKISGGIGCAFNSGITSYNSGYTTADAVGNTNFNQKQFFVPETINDYYSDMRHTSKYGHDEAVETINSLPDTSAAGGGNIIKFAGQVGRYTNWLKGKSETLGAVDSRINTLTEEEIAVATAKGWTVELV